MINPFSQLTDHKHFGVVYFDNRFQIVELNSVALDMLKNTGDERPAGQLHESFPELVGSEEQMERIIAKKEGVFHLAYVNRSDRDGNTRYWDLLLLAAPEADGGVLVIEDTTEKAIAIKTANQNRYETYLYRHSIDHRRNQIGNRFKGRSAAHMRIVDTIHKLAKIPSATVMLMGETGTGKNLTARMIHESSALSEKPFVEINCAALPEQLIEAELFGYEKGAFTHAVAAKPGLLEEAHGGTLFLDEIGELPINMQAKLLSTIESKSFRRLGSTKQREVNIRIIAATNRDLRLEVSAKRFREDLYYRLNVVSITLPPLRELGEDVLLIAEHFIDLLNVDFNKHVKRFSPEARKALLQHHWPGNVRELSNCIERAMIFVETDTINRSDLVLTTPADGSDVFDDACWSVPATGIDLEEVERRLILSALHKTDNNKSKAARLLGLTRHTLRYRMDKHGLT